MADLPLSALYLFLPFGAGFQPAAILLNVIVVLYINHPLSFVSLSQRINVPASETSYEIPMRFSIRVSYECTLKTVKCYTNVNDFISYHQ